MSESHSSRRLTLSVIGALLTSALLLFTVILPAEYGYDPLGTGAALGLNALSEQGEQALVSTQSGLQNDTMVFELAPFEGVEYKYRLAQGETLLFSWKATAELLFDLHAEPDGAAPGLAETFEKSRAQKRSGTYTAPFDGIHGWFWQNRTEKTITLTHKASGFFGTSLEMRDGHTLRYRIEGSEKIILERR